MTMRLIPHAAAVSEFIAGYNGDCGETAEMALLHVINPSAYPLNSADLSTIVKRDISKGWASANGSEPINAIANDLHTLGLRYTNYGFSQPASFDWRGMLAQWGGVKPIVFEYARAANLPGDESGVQYHFNTCLGWDDAAHTGLFADGDNIVERSGGTALVHYTEADLANANLCGMLVGEYELGAATPSGGTTGGTTSMWHQVSAGVMADSHGVETRYAMAAYLAAHTDTPDVVSGCGGETYISAETSILPLAGAPGALVYQKSDNAVHTDQAGIVLWEQHMALAAAQAAEAQAQSQLAQAQQQAQQEVSAAEAQAQHDAAIIGSQSGQIATLTQQTHDQAAQIAALKAQLATAQQQPAPTPAPVPAPAPAPTTPAPTTPADAAALLVTLIYAEADATLKAASAAPRTGA